MSKAPPTTVSTWANEPPSEAERAKIKAERTLICAILDNDMAAFDRVLAESGSIINISMESSGKMTPLHTAAAQGRKEMAEKLLAKKANLEAKNGLGFTPLVSAVLGNHEGVLSVLLKAGADKNVTTTKGETALSLAQQKGSSNIAALLK